MIDKNSMLKKSKSRLLALTAMPIANVTNIKSVQNSPRPVAQLRGVRCTPEQVIIFNSAQQALSSLALLLLDPGDAAWME